MTIDEKINRAAEEIGVIRRCAFVISNHSRDGSDIQCQREDIYHRPLDPSSQIAHEFVPEVAQSSSAKSETDK